MYNKREEDLECPTLVYIGPCMAVVREQGQMTFTTCGVIVGSRILVVMHRACHAVGKCSECLMRMRSMHAKACACRQYAESTYQHRMAAML